MPKTSYNTVNGLIVGQVEIGEETRSTDFQLDSLGSVIGTLNASNGNLLNTYRYAGYGQQVSKTGANADPKFLWVGGWGYRQSFYVRRRHVSTRPGGWTSSDALWPAEEPFVYVSCNPCSWIDPTGNQLITTMPLTFPLARPWGPIPIPKIRPFPRVGPSPPFAAPYEESPTSEWGEYAKRCGRVDEANKRRQNCYELHEWYKTWCLGRGTGMKTWPPCTAGGPWSDKWQIELLTENHCNCCLGRREFEKRCAKYYPARDQKSHADTANRACRRCEECMTLSSRKPKLHEPPGPRKEPLPYPDPPEGWA